MNSENSAPNTNQTQRSLAPNAPPSSAGPLYTSHLSEDDLSDLTSGAREGCLGDEIALLRILVRRHLARPPSDQLQDGGATWAIDAARLGSLLATLCRALKASRSAGDIFREQLNAALPTLFAELDEEQGFPFARPEAE
ncbi:MAG: hypothetical protein HY675_26710 [Chloroflexi bacterium]|nr:hypothetical protein [Chloroflexota bacterium]